MVMKRAKKKNGLFPLVMAVIIVLVAGLLSAYAVEMGDVTAHSVYVRYYGVSNYPLNSQTGKIQTYVKLDGTTLRNLKYSGGAISVARSIVQVADFGNSMVGLYKGEAPVPVPTSALDAVISAADVLTAKFADDTTCLRTIGRKYGSRSSFEFVVVTDMSYQQCSYYDDWLVARARHTYYTKSGSYICRQLGTKLFSIEMGTGKTSKSTWGC